MRRMERCGIAAFPLMAVVAMLVCFSTAAAQWENRGDLNLNGLPFELADAAIFADYFAAGIDAFAIDPAPQIAATDINMDGMVLTVADFVMMIRIEMGAGDPPPVDPGTFTVSIIYTYTDTSVIASARFARIPAAMYLEYDFAAQPSYTARLLRSDGSISMGTADAGLVVTMLITGMNNIPTGSECVPLVELAYQGAGPTSINGCVLGATGDQGMFAVDSTYRVGDANDDEKINIGDAVFIVNWIFRGGFVPPHLQAVDANCDQAYNIGDAVYIVNYVFRGGQGPCGMPTGGLVSHSDCLSLEKNGADGEMTAIQDCLEYQYDGQGTLLLTHTNTGLNCCPDFAAVVSMAAGVITIDETPVAGNCECLCLFNLDYQVVDLPSGTYQVIVREQCLSGEDLPLQFTVDLVSAPAGSVCLERNHYPW
jgi:hypothetical protein